MAQIYLRGLVLFLGLTSNIETSYETLKPWPKALLLSYKLGTWVSWQFGDDC
jgi:hypothetical protein